jgi:hypothetical protein
MSHVINDRTTRWLLSASPFGAGAATFASLFTYVPDSWFAPNGTQLGRYTMALAGALAVGFGLQLAVGLEVHFTKATQEISSVNGGLMRWSNIQRETNQALIDTRLQSSIGFGWSHFLNSSPNSTPTPLASAYGIKVAALCGNEPSRIEWEPVVAFILSRQVAGGGWAGESHGLKPRPEITATVVSALAVAGVSEPDLESSIIRLRSLCSDKSDLELWQRTYLLASSLTDLLEVSPVDSTVEELAHTLMRGALICEQSEVAWGESIGASIPRPSTAHTARALVALHKYRHHAQSAHHPQSAHLNQIIEHGTRWLLKHANLNTQTEQLNRHLSKEQSSPRHFTAAWVVRALAYSGLDSTDATMNRALHEMMSYFNRGLWRWYESEAPIWMTYQSLRALHSLATVPVVGLPS